MGNDRQSPSDTETDRQIALRNFIRRQAGLPLVAHSEELNRVHKVQEQREFEKWMQSPLRYRVERKLLERIRRRINSPDWNPTGMLSGGGWAFHAALTKQMRKLKPRLTD